MISQEDISNFSQNRHKEQSHLSTKKQIHLKRNLQFLCLTFALDRQCCQKFLVSKKLLDYFIHGNKELKNFRQERFIEK